MHHYYIGLDLGQSRDYTALAIIEEPVWLGNETTWDAFNVFWDEKRVKAGGWVLPSDLAPRYAHNAMAVNVNYGRPAYPPLHLRHLERFPLGTKYDEIIRRVIRMLKSDPIRTRLRHTSLLVDKTGVGAAVIDHFHQARVYPYAITIHGGSEVRAGMRSYNVPKKDLVSATQVLIQNGRLQIAEELEHAEVLKKEMLNFRMKQNPATAHETYEHWREGDHDDLILAVAMAAWHREYLNAEQEAWNVRRGGFRDRSLRPGEFEGYASYGT